MYSYIIHFIKQLRQGKEIKCMACRVFYLILGKSLLNSVIQVRSRNISGCSKEPSHQMVILSIHNICFGREIRRIFKYALCG